VPKGDAFCLGHPEVAKDLREIKQIQRDRACGSHEARLGALERADERIEKDDDDQWTAINQLRQTVWFGRGIMALAAFLGSGLGALLISYFVKK